MKKISIYATVLRHARERHGLTQEALGERMHFGQGYVGHVEAGSKPPTEEFTRRADVALELDGLLEAIRTHTLRQEATPEWLEDWWTVEQEATHIWWFELSVVSGLLQTEAYAREVLRGDEAKMAARLNRQEVLARDSPPAYVAVMDERALRYPVGDQKIMTEQLEHLVAMSAQVVIQVVPAECGTYLHLDGAFGLAQVDGREYVYVDTPVRGFMLSEQEVILRTRRRWDLIRAEALSRHQTKAFIQKVVEQWT